MEEIMKDKEWKIKKTKVKTIIDKWVKDLGLGWYEINIEWKAGDAQERGDGYLCVMEVVSRWMYRTATIRIWLEEVPEDGEKLERMVVHELCHILVEPMRSERVTENEEHVVESLARAFLWTVEGVKRRIKK